MEQPVVGAEVGGESDAWRARVQLTHETAAASFASASLSTRSMRRSGMSHHSATRTANGRGGVCVKRSWARAEVK